MKKKQLIPAIFLIVISSLLLVFASLSRLEHWNVNYFYLFVGLSFVIFIAGIYSTFIVAKK